MQGTPEETKNWVRGYYAGSTDLYLKNWAGSVHGFHLGLDDGSCQSRDDALAAANAYLAERAHVGQGTRVLDAGCGVGGSSMWLARHLGACVTGITIAPEQVQIAERLAEAAGLARLVSFREMDFAATTFAAASFDVVWNIESICHSFDKRQYFDHILTLLAPGGRFVCLEMFCREGRESGEAQRTCEASWSMPPLATVEQVRSWLAEVGFVGIECENLNSKVRRPLGALRAMALNARQMLRIEQAIAGSVPHVHEAHVRGALACVDAADEGAFDYWYVGARRP
jgi:cyclopropane fatty-acyl-phospholipid synthase-like methyltransferase